MNYVDVSLLRSDPEAVIASAQTSDVALMQDGKLVAIVTRPRAPVDFEAYWKEREAALAVIPPMPDWDSADSISEDRERA